jgi:tetratricopeptide (TPR) repeat protein
MLKRSIIQFNLFLLTSLPSFFSESSRLFRSLHYTGTVVMGMAVFAVFYVSKCASQSHLKGVAYFNEGKYVAAMNCYNEYLMLHPHHINTLYNRGRCHELLDEPEKARFDYNEVLLRDPDHVNALLGLSQILYADGEYISAINLCKHATLVDGDNYLAHYYLARAFHKTGKLSSALDSYNIAIDLNPDFGFAYFHRSSVMLSFGFLPYGCYDLQTAAYLNVEGAEEALEKYCRR